MPGPTSRHFISQRLRLHYVDWGNPDAPPLLLVHGGRDHCRNWDWVAQALRRDWHIICPDLRGHGDSQWSPDGNYSMSAYIYDLAQLIHQQKLAPVTIVAHSLGGNICLRYTGIYPEQRAQAGRHRGPGPVAQGDRRARPQEHGRAHARLDRRAAQALRPPAAPLSDRSRMPSSACRRRTSISRPSRRAISRSRASTRTRTAPTAGSSTTTCAPTPPYDMSYPGHRAAVDADHLPDPAGLRQGELGLQSGEGRAAEALQDARGRRVRQCRPLGAPRPARRLRRHGGGASSGLTGSSTERQVAVRADRRNPRLHRLREVAGGRAAADRAVRPDVAARDHRPGAGLEGPSRAACRGRTTAATGCATGRA